MTPNLKHRNTDTCGTMTERELREKLIVSGADKLSDAELVAVVIREGTGSHSALELAEKILRDFAPDEAGPPTLTPYVSITSASRSTHPQAPSQSVSSAGMGALAALASADIQRIRRAGGCGTQRAVAIAAAAELARRIVAAKALAVNRVASKEDVAMIFAPLADLPHEEFWVLYLSSGGRVLDRTKVSQGGVSGTVVDYKLVVKRAVELLASSFILVHNHPSGLSQPSREDIAITDNIRSAAALFDINVVDHIIVSRSGTFSFSEKGHFK